MKEEKELEQLKFGDFGANLMKGWLGKDLKLLAESKNFDCQ